MQPSGCQLPSLESVSSSVQVTKFICYQAAWTSWFSYLIQALPFILKTEGGWQVWMRWFCTGGNCFLVICSPCLYFGSLCYLLQVKSTSLENNENMLIFLYSFLNSWAFASCLMNWKLVFKSLCEDFCAHHQSLTILCLRLKWEKD